MRYVCLLDIISDNLTHLSARKLVTIKQYFRKQFPTRFRYFGELIHLVDFPAISAKGDNSVSAYLLTAQQVPSEKLTSLIDRRFTEGEYILYVKRSTVSEGRQSN